MVKAGVKASLNSALRSHESRLRLVLSEQMVPALLSNGQPRFTEVHKNLNEASPGTRDPGTDESGTSLGPHCRGQSANGKLGFGVATESVS